MPILTQPLTISSPSRLHFGLFSVGQKVARKYGGMGMMISQPRTTIRFESSDSFHVQGESEATIRETVRQIYHADLAVNGTSSNQPPVRITVLEVPPRHVGFGSGTQLALTVAIGLLAFFDQTLPSVNELVPRLGRGNRSAIGSYGFFRGGVIVERGKTEGETLSPLDFQTDFPAGWPVVTAVLRDHQTVFGSEEKKAFSNLQPSSEKMRAHRIALVKNHILPAIEKRDYRPFAESIFEFGRLSGMLFESIQGGAYNGPDVTKLVNSIRDFGVPAVGQSSWGPCVFAVTESDSAAVDLKNHLDKKWGDRAEVQITGGDNRGAVITHRLDQKTTTPN